MESLFPARTIHVDEWLGIVSSLHSESRSWNDDSGISFPMDYADGNDLIVKDPTDEFDDKRSSSI